MVRRHSIPPRSPQVEGDGSQGEGKRKDPTGGKNPAGGDLKDEQANERRKNYGREQGGNQQGNQRGVAKPGDR
jgi:hypothetical protein